MTKRTMTKWVKALRSGAYSQATSSLKARYPDGELAHCCLGVLADETGCRMQNVDGGEEGTEWFVAGDSVLSPRQLKRLGMNDELQSKLAKMNDNGWTFKRIATFIEKNYTKFRTWGEDTK